MIRCNAWRCMFGLLAAAALVAAGGVGRQRPRIAVVPPFVPPADAPEYVANHVLVKFEAPIASSQIDAMFAPLGARWLKSGVDDAFEVLEVAPGSVKDWVDFLSGIPGVEYAEPDYLAWMCGTPDDPLFKPYQWNFFDYGTLSNGHASNFGVQGMTAWDTTTGAGTIVAVVDTGVAYEDYDGYSLAPDLAGVSFVAPWDFVNDDAHPNDDNNHGTHVTGTICQATNNTLGVAGLAYGCQIMPVKVLNESGGGSSSWIADGIRWAADNGANVINLSLGGTTNSKVMQDAVDYAWGKDCVLCAAAGNNGSGTILYPARYTHCIAVGATRFDGERCSYSQYGVGLDVMAPGGDVSVDQNEDGYPDGILQQTFHPGNYGWFGYAFFSGTSMATPHVSAIAALVKSNQSSYTNADVRAAIENTCTDLDKKGYDKNTGWGLVNAAAAINY
jgi:serine protease